MLFFALFVYIRRAFYKYKNDVFEQKKESIYIDILPLKLFGYSK